MSSNAGVPGSIYLQQTPQRVQTIHALLPSGVSLWADGGMTSDRAKELIPIGCDGFVFGRAFLNEEHQSGILDLKKEHVPI